MIDFSSRLIRWQRLHGRHDLPWQNTTDPYRIWLSEIMLQQTQVAAVVPYFIRFTDAFPDLQTLAAAPLQRVLELWSGLGYYSRARNLHRCAQQLIAEHGGEFPREPDDVAKLPGIGRSTAAAICAFAYGKRAAILDGNVKRVLARHAGIEGFPGERAVELRLWEAANARLPTEQRSRPDQSGIREYTQGLMDLGATLCTRSKPHCDRCPVADDCNALATGRVAMLPAPRPRKIVPRRGVTMLLVMHQESVLVERRAPTGIWGGLWSLPELPDGISAASYCATRFAADVRVEPPLAAIEHGFTHFQLTITPQPCRVLALNRRAEEPGLLWLPLMEAKTAALPAPIKKFLSSLGNQWSQSRLI